MVTKLSNKEEIILEEISKLKQEKEIANDLNLSPLTVNTHISNIKKKIKDINGLPVTRREELIAFFICKIKGKTFDLKQLRDKGISIILILINLCCTPYSLNRSLSYLDKEI